MREFDIVVWGCSGFTGRLACEYISKTYPDLKWAIAGRNKQVLEELKHTLQLKDSVAVLIASLSDSASLEVITSKTQVLLSTAGPYANIGTPIIDASVKSGTHYCDITGETPWIRDIIDKYHYEAKEKKLKIVNCCGFDCIPSDLGAQMIVEELLNQNAIPTEVRFTAYDVKGGVSGGTAFSMMNMFAANSFSKLLSLLNPYFLNPRNPQTQQPTPSTADKILQSLAGDKMVCDYDELNKCWTIPYIMQAIDTRIVNRSNALLDWRYGSQFVFTERMRVPNVFIAVVASLITPIVSLLFMNPLGRAVLRRVLPSPGQGPSQYLLDHGHMKMRLWGKGVHRDTGKEVLVRGGVTALHGDPGYRQTAKMVAETAVCLALDQSRLPHTHGVLTPASGLGAVLRERLIARGVDFHLADKKN